MKKILQVALPIALAHLLVMTMGLVDLAFIRHVGTTATGAVGVGSALFGWALTIGMGLLAGLDYFVSTSYGGGKLRQCHTYFGQGLWLSLITGIPLSALLFLMTFKLNWLGIHPDVIGETSEFLRVLGWGLAPVYVFTACRNYLQAMSRPLVPFYLLLVANFANALFDYVFIFGAWGFPAMGVRGVAAATTICRFGMAAVLLGYAFWVGRKASEKLTRADLRFQRQPFVHLIQMGFPATLQMMLEVGVFGLSTVLAGGLDPRSLAAHQIVLNIASTTFMVTLGVGAATAVLVGQSLGRRDGREAAAMGWRGLGISAVFMVGAGTILLSFPQTILAGFTADLTVLQIAGSLLLIAAIFQLADGLQASLTGALRGLGDTRTAVWANLVGHWLIGLPICLWLTFHRGWGVSGIWAGIASGLFVVAIWLFIKWSKKIRQTHFRLSHLD